MKIYNTLSHSVEEISPITPGKIGIYSCGPTVYDYQHIGHMRRYVGDDILIRVLRHNNLDVHHVMNITDVGHLVSDADSGEDKMEKGAKKFGLSVWDIAKKFEAQFTDSCALLNITLPTDLMHATDFIPEQIDLIKKLEGKGFTYKTTDGIYFDTSKFENYFKLSRQNPEELKAGARVDMGDKKNVSDFALWKFSYENGRSFDSTQDDSATRRQMEWESPWGVGFPGWHIECSAMSMKALGESFDIHTGGIDHISIHHTNEIAQAEAATDKQFVKYWVHHAFLTVEGEKMSKSIGNTYTVEDVKEKGFDPMSLRYLYLQTHYRQEMNFTWQALEAAQTALKKLWDEAQVFGAYSQSTPDDREPSDVVKKRFEEFVDSINDDLNMPRALAALHSGLKEKETDFDVLYLLGKTDPILGLNFISNGKKLWENHEEKFGLPKEVKELINKREEMRKAGNYGEADKIRNEISEFGFTLEDSPTGVKIKKN